MNKIVREMSVFEIGAPEDRLDLEFCFLSGQVFRWQRLPDDSWLGIEGDYWYRITQSASTLEVESNATADDLIRFLRLDWNAVDMEKRIVTKAPELEPYMDALKGLRVLRQSDPVETFFTFLCTPNNNIKRITQMVHKLAARGPLLKTVDGVDLHRFPEAEVIAAIPEQELRTESFGYRAKTIPHLAQQLIERGDRKYLTDLKNGPYKDAHRELVSMKGIGPKLADCICLFGLHHDEAVPVDTHIWQAMVRLYFPQYKDAALTDKRYYEAADFFRDRLGNLAGWAHQYLFYDNVLNWRNR